MAVSQERSGAIVQAYVGSIGAGAQVAIGNNILQVRAEEGAVVTVAMPEDRPIPRLRSEPIHRLPRAFPDLLGRESELESARSAVREGGSVDFHAASGMGKTSLLRHLAHLLSDEDQPHLPAVLFAPAQRQSVDDLLQFVFDELYETDRPMKATGAELRHFLQDRHGVVLFDDVDLSREDLQILLDSVPGAAFVAASSERLLWGEGVALEVGGLPLDAALAMLERELGRELDPTERPAARSLCDALGGSPLRIVQAAAATRTGRSIAELAEDVDRDKGTAHSHLLALSDEEQKVLDLLAALEGTALHGRLIATATGVPDPSMALASLQQRGLVTDGSPRYRVTEVVEPSVEEGQHREGLQAAAVSAIAHWVETGPSIEAVGAETESILWGVAWAAEHQQWEVVLRLQRGAETGFIIGRRWGAWGALLDRAVDAATALDDNRELALALHQRGTRAGALDPGTAGRSDLTSAIRLREEAGDELGAAISRHNLQVLSGPSPGPPGHDGDGPQPPGPRMPPWRRILAGAMAVGAVAGGLVLLRRHNPTKPPRLESGDVVLSSDQMDFGSRVLEGPAGEGAIELSNKAGAAVSIRRIRIEGKNPDDFTILNDSCSGQIAPRGQCDLMLVFKPLELGPRTGLLRVSLEGGPGDALIQLIGKGSKPALVIGSTRLNFGRRQIHTTSTKSVFVTNQWTKPIRMRRVLIEKSPGSTFKVTYKGCGHLKVGERCRVRVAFSPLSTGRHSGVLAFHYTGPGPALRIDVLGEGTKGKPSIAVLPSTSPVTPAPNFSPGTVPCSGAPLVPPTSPFGEVEAPGESPGTIMVMNDGPGSCYVTDVSHEGPSPPFAITANLCYQSVLDPGESCSVDVTFSPPGDNSYTDNLRVAFADPGESATVELTGVGLDTRPPSTPPAFRWGIPACPQPMLWGDSTDEVGVVGYHIYKNGSSTPIQTQSGTGFTDPNGGYGDKYTVDAYDAAGNRSNVTEPPLENFTCG